MRIWAAEDFADNIRRKSMADRIEIMDTFLEKLKEDSIEYKGLETERYSIEDKKRAIRSLMNIRMPKVLPDELAALQNAYLQEELKEKGVVALSDIPTVKEESGSSRACAEKISLWKGDITRLEAGAIVNAANSQMLGCFVPCHRCIDNAIHSAAGIQLREECSHIMGERRMKYGRNYEEPAGTATLTSAYNLPCDYVIHTVGPIVYGDLNDKLCKDLQNCYENVLKCCAENNIKSVAFCCISTGEFHFPKDIAAKIAIQTVTDFLQENKSIERVVFNVFTQDDYDIYRELLAF